MSIFRHHQKTYSRSNARMVTEKLFPFMNYSFMNNKIPNKKIRFETYFCRFFPDNIPSPYQRKKKDDDF